MFFCSVLAVRFDNERGELIGIVNAREPDTSINNMSYAIPSNVAKAIADNAI